MIRSLVAPMTKTHNGPHNQEAVIRRNLPIEDLERTLIGKTKVWLDVTDPEEEEINWLQEQFKLHPLVVSDLRRQDRRPSMQVHTDYIFLSLFQPISSRQQILAEEIHCLIGETFLVTVRNTKSDSVDEAYDRAAHNVKDWNRGVVYFLYIVTQCVVDSYYPILDNISLRLNELEESLLSNGKEVSQRSIYRIKQQLISLRQMVAPQREVLSNAIGEERLSRSNESRDLFRHLYERLVRIYDIIDSQRDLSSNVLDLIQSQTSARLAEGVNRLTIFSMIFLPLTFLIGLFELNFITTEPELTIPLHGLFVLVIILVLMSISAGGMVWFFKRRGWL